MSMSYISGRVADFPISGRQGDKIAITGNAGEALVGTVGSEDGFISRCAVK